MREMRLLHTSHEPWILSHYEPCSYGCPLSDKYNDTIETRLCVKTYQRDFCGIGFTSTHTETRRLHEHPLPYLNILPPLQGAFFVLGAFPSLRRDKIPLRCFFRS